MNVLVDTSVWSLALRRRARDLGGAEQRLAGELAELIREGRAQLAGPVRQELLTGVRSPAQFERLRADLRAFEEPVLVPDDYEEAARAANHCRARGLAGSTIDFLLCAIALRRDWHLFTTDRDFTRYARHLPLRLHRPQPQG